MQKPLFNFGKPKKVSKKKKTLPYHKTKLKPWGDADRDGYLNIFDCKPYDPKKHGVPKGQESRKIQSFTKSGQKTWGTLWKELEDEKTGNIMFWHERGKPGGPYSDVLGHALEEREEFQKKIEESGEPSPFRSIAGKVHTVELSGDVSPGVVFGQHHMKSYLGSVHPYKQFHFDPKEPSKVTVVDAGRVSTKPVGRVISDPVQPMQVVEWQGKSSQIKKREELQEQMDQLKLRKRTIQKAPWWIEELPKHMSTTSKPMKMFVTDDPLHVIRKSSWPSGSNKDFTYRTCETIEGPPEGYMYPWEEDYPYMRGFEKHEMNVGPFRDIGTAQAVGYFYPTSAKDEDILTGKKAPSARVMFRWHTPSGRWKDKKYVGVSNRVYPYRSESEEEKMYRFGAQQFMKKKGLHTEYGYTPYKVYGYSDTISQGDEDVQQEAHELGYLDEDYEPVYDTIHRGGYYGLPEHEVHGFPRWSLMPDIYMREYSVRKRTPSVEESERMLLSQDKIPRSHAKLLADTKKEYAEIITNKEGMSTEVISPLAFYPSKRIKRRVSNYPKLQQESIKHLQEYSKDKSDTDIQKRLFVNPSLTKKQRIQMFREDELLPKRISPYFTEVEKTTAKQIYRMTPEKHRPHLASNVSQKQGSLMLEILTKGTEAEKKQLLISGRVPNKLVEYYVRLPTAKKNYINDIISIYDPLSDSLAKLIYKKYGNDPKVLAKLLSTGNVTESIRKNIQGKVFKNSALQDYYVHNFETLKPDLMLQAVDKLDKSYLEYMLRRLSSMYDRVPSADKITDKLFMKAIKERDYVDTLENFLERTQNDEVENVALKVLDKQMVTEDVYKVTLRYLMNTRRKEIIDELIKRYG